MTLPTGYQFTAVNQGTDDGIDSDINPTTGTSDCITLAAGQADPNLDAGAVPSSAPTATPTSTPASTTPGSVGNQVWEDTNGNGIQDFGEPYVQGVTVELLRLHKHHRAGNPNYRWLLQLTTWLQVSIAFAYNSWSSTP